MSRSAWPCSARSSPSRYHQTLSPTLAALPATARGAAGGSIAATQAVAAQLGSAGRFLLGPANDAFVSAMHVTTIVAAVIALAGAIVVLRWMPGLSAAPAAAQESPEPAAPERTASPEQAAPERAMLQPVAVEAAAVSQIDPVDAVDVWQENLSARTGQPRTGQRQPAGGQARRRDRRWTRRMSTSSTCGQETSPISHTAWKDRK